MAAEREGPGIPRRSRFKSLECGDEAHDGCRGASGALWCGCPCHYTDARPHRHPAVLLASPKLPAADSPVVICARAETA